LAYLHDEHLNTLTKVGAGSHSKAHAIAAAVKGALVAICPTSELLLHEKTMFINGRAASSKQRVPLQP